MERKKRVAIVNFNLSKEKRTEDLKNTQIYQVEQFEGIDPNESMRMWADRFGELEDRVDTAPYHLLFYRADDGSVTSVEWVIIEELPEE